MKECKKCGRFIDLIMPLDTRTECICREFTIIDEDGDSFSGYGTDAEDAVKRFAERTDADRDYMLLENGTSLFLVKDQYGYSQHVTLEATQEGVYQANIVE